MVVIKSCLFDFAGAETDAFESSCLSSATLSAFLKDSRVSTARTTRLNLEPHAWVNVQFGLHNCHTVTENEHASRRATK
jgi:hypothetical protein